MPKTDDKKFLLSRKRYLLELSEAIRLDAKKNNNGKTTQEEDEELLQIVAEVTEINSKLVRFQALQK